MVGPKEACSEGCQRDLRLLVRDFDVEVRYRSHDEVDTIVSRVVDTVFSRSRANTNVIVKQVRSLNGEVLQHVDYTYKPGTDVYRPKTIISRK
jgi:hypothetical protein